MQINWLTTNNSIEMAGMQSLIHYYSPKVLTPFVSWMMDKSHNKYLSRYQFEGRLNKTAIYKYIKYVFLI